MQHIICYIYKVGLFQRVIERYHTALQQKTNELVSVQIKMKDLKTEKDELTKAYMCCKARADLIEDEKNEALRKYVNFIDNFCFT